MESDKIFIQLKSILTAYESRLALVHNKPDNYYLNTQSTEKNKKPEFFAAVQIKKSYVAFHLMPIYSFPELLNNVSEALKSKMQGKSCFNFKEENLALFEELNALVKTSFEKYQALEKI